MTHNGRRTCQDHAGEPRTDPVCLPQPSSVLCSWDHLVSSCAMHFYTFCTKIRDCPLPCTLVLDWALFFFFAPSLPVLSSSPSPNFGLDHNHKTAITGRSCQLLADRALCWQNSEGTELSSSCKYLPSTVNKNFSKACNSANLSRS